MRLLLLRKQLIYIKKQDIDKTIEMVDSHVKKASLKSWLSGIKFVSLIVWVISFTGLGKSLGSGTTLDQAYKNAAFIFYIGPLAFIVWLSLFLYEKSLNKKASLSSDGEILEKKVESVLESSLTQLTVPDDAVRMDILVFRYKIKNGEIKKSKYWNDYFL